MGLWNNRSDFRILVQVAAAGFYGRTNGVNAFCSTSLLYGIAPIPAILATVCSNMSTAYRLFDRDEVPRFLVIQDDLGTPVF
jgi:hypothetical protein